MVASNTLVSPGSMGRATMSSGRKYTWRFPLACPMAGQSNMKSPDFQLARQRLRLHEIHLPTKSTTNGVFGSR